MGFDLLFSFGLSASVLAISSVAMVDPQSVNRSCLSSRGEVLYRSQCIRSRAIVGDDGSKVPFSSAAAMFHGTCLLALLAKLYYRLQTVLTHENVLTLVSNRRLFRPSVARLALRARSFKTAV